MAGPATQMTLAASTTTVEEGQDGGAVADRGGGSVRTRQTPTPNLLALSVEELWSDLGGLKCWLRYEDRGVYESERALAAVASGWPAPVHGMLLVDERWPTPPRPALWRGLSDRPVSKAEDPARMAMERPGLRRAPPLHVGWRHG